MKNLLKNKFVQLLLRDALEAAIVTEPVFITALKGQWDLKALAAVAAAFAVAFVAALRRQISPPAGA